MSRFRRWWSTARSSVITHRRLKWFWILLIPLSWAWKDVVPWVVFMSHYAIVVGHWSGEEGAKAEEKAES